MLDAHIISPALKRCQTQPELNSTLMKEARSLQSKYLAASSLLIAYINSQNGKEHKDDYFNETKRLAQAVLSIGSQLYEIYNFFDDEPLSPHSKKTTFSDLSAKKKKLTIELSYTEFLTGTSKPKWQDYLDANSDIHDTTIDSVIRFITARTNWYRLFMIRLKRLFTNFMPLVKSINYQWFVFEINRINPVLSYVAWLFYVPRLSANLYSLFIHTYPGPWMNKSERSVSFENRWKMHWERLWFEILNDAVWLAVGLACCFFLSPANSVLLTAGLYFFDAGMAFANHYFSTIHHKKLRAELDNQLTSLKALLGELSGTKLYTGSNIKEEIASIEKHKQHIDLWIEYERQNLILSMFVTTMFSISMTIGALPILFTLGATFAIACPIISACIVVSVCIIQYISASFIEGNCPQSNILKLEQLEEHIKEHKAFNRRASPTSKEESPQESEKVDEIPLETSKNSQGFFARPKLLRNISCPSDLRQAFTNSENLTNNTLSA